MFYENKKSKTVRGGEVVYGGENTYITIDDNQTTSRCPYTRTFTLDVSCGTSSPRERRAGLPPHIHTHYTYIHTHNLGNGILFFNCNRER